MTDDVNPPCAGCGGPHPFDTSLPSVRWNAIIRAHGYPDYLCLTCIVKAFALANESFAATLWGGFFNGTAISVRINDQPSIDVAAVSVENTALRAELQQWRSWAQFVFNGGGSVTATDDELRTMVCERYDADLDIFKREFGSHPNEGTR